MPHPIGDHSCNLWKNHPSAPPNPCSSLFICGQSPSSPLRALRVSVVHSDLSPPQTAVSQNAKTLANTEENPTSP